jgi:prophage regulatory protein
MDSSDKKSPRLILDEKHEVCETVGYRPAKLYASIAAGTFTKPVKIGRMSRWPRHENEEIVAAIIAGASEEELRRLVDRLHEARKAFRRVLDTNS